jgi:Fuc2NAc and GlcNAc transferase
MRTQTTLNLALVCALLAWGLTWVIRGYALRAKLLDRPNERSSHTVPTPRGGGVAIVSAFFVALVALGYFAFADLHLLAGLGGACATVALLGFLDDRHGLSARLRIVGHAAAAAWCLAWIGPLPSFQVLGLTVDLGIGASVLGALYIVWSINLFNFMDGIDGIASLEAISVGLGGALVWWLVQPAGDWPVTVLFAACVSGFLVWNFPTARIFMGDAGSGSLGLVVAVLALWSSRATPHLFWCWLILSGCFIVDATTTLIRRVLRGERFYQAHRHHAFQYAARKHASHKVVSLSVVAINTLWLLPLAVAVALQWMDSLAGLLLAYGPLLWLALLYKAGDRAGQGELA